MPEESWNKVFRRIKSKPVFMKDGRPSSALFKDSQGVSVNMDLGRILNDIIIEEERLHKLYLKGMTEEEIQENGEALKAIISLTKKDCDNVNVLVVPDPIPNENKYHALIKKSETEIQLSKGQARALAKLAVVEKSYS